MKKIMKSIVFILFFLVNFLNIIQAQDNENGRGLGNGIIIGKWCYSDSSQNYIQYLPSGVVKYYIGNEQRSESYYRLVQKSDTVYVHNSLNVIGRPVRISGDYMESFGFKIGKGVETHIDEYILLVKETGRGDPLRFDSGIPITKYILPNGFRGQVVIAYNQSQGVEPEYDLDGNRIVRIPSNGLLETQFREDAFGTAGRRYRVYIEDSLAQNLLELPVADKYDGKRRASFGALKTVVIMQGFNQATREDVNKAFHKSILGNTMMFFVGGSDEVACLKIGVLQ